MAKADKKTPRVKKENALVVYFRETRGELRKVHWPTREESITLTKIVLVVTISMAAFLGLLDYLFAMELKGLISGNALAVAVAVIVVVGSALATVIISRQTAR